MRMTPLWYEEIISNTPSWSRPPPFSKDTKGRVFSLALFGKARCEAGLLRACSSWHTVRIWMRWGNRNKIPPVEFPGYWLDSAWNECTSYNVHGRKHFSCIFLIIRPPKKKKTTPRTGMNNIMTHFHLKCSLLVAATLVTRYEIHVYHAHHVYHVYMYVFVSALSFMVQTFGMEVPICADCMLPRGSETSKLELSKRIDTLHRYCNKASKWLWSILVIVSTKKKISKVSQDVQVRSNKMMLSRKIWHTIPQHLKSLPTKTNDLLEPFSFLEDLPECRWHLIPRSMQWNDVRSLWKLKRLSPKIQPQLSI